MTEGPGGEPRDERVETNPDADLAEVLRDDALLDAIGSRRESGWMDLPDDEVTRLLTAWQVDAATYAAARTRQPVDTPAASVAEPARAEPIQPRRRHARPGHRPRVAPRSAAAISAAAVAGVVLSIGGVAAAVTGNPLTPLRAVVSGLAPAPDDGRSDVTSVMPRELANVRTAISEGHLVEARRKLTDVREQAKTLSPGPDQANTLVVIEDLEERLEAAEQQGTASETATATPSPSATPTDGGTETPTSTPTATPTPTPTATAEPTPTPSSTSNGKGHGKIRSSPEHPEPPQDARYDGGS